jgi:predicted TPR repeat methyltransferase
VSETFLGAAPNTCHKILDLGCGSGLCGAALSSNSFHITGVDINPNHMEVAVNTGAYQRLVRNDISATSAQRHFTFYDDYPSKI